MINSNVVPPIGGLIVDGPSKTETVQSMSSWQSGLICKGLKQTVNSESMVPVPVVKMTVFFEYKNRLPVV